jgi:hypothetical protein
VPFHEDVGCAPDVDVGNGHSLDSWPHRMGKQRAALWHLP